MKLFMECTLYHDFLINEVLLYAMQAGLVAQSDACSTGDQEVESSRLQSGPILSLRLIMKSFLQSFSPFH